MHSFNKKFNLFPSFQSSLFIFFPFTNKFCILFGSFSYSLIFPSLKYIPSNLLSSSIKSSSSLLFKQFLNLVNNFWILSFIPSLSFSIFSNTFFISLIDCCKFIDKSSKHLIFSSNFSFFSFSISSNKHILQSVCWPIVFVFILVIHSEQHT